MSVDRARVRDCAWTGVWVGFNAVGGHYDTLDIDGTLRAESLDIPQHLRLAEVFG